MGRVGVGDRYCCIRIDDWPEIRTRPSAPNSRPHVDCVWRHLRRMGCLVFLAAQRSLGMTDTTCLADLLVGAVLPLAGAILTIVLTYVYLRRRDDRRP